MVLNTTLTTMSLYCSLPIPGSPRPVEWSLNLSRRREMFCHLPNVLSPSSFLLTLHAKWSCLSTHYPQNFLAWLLSALSLSPSPALVYLLGSPPKPRPNFTLMQCSSSISPTGSGSPCLQSCTTFPWYFGSGMCSLPGAIYYHVIRFSHKGSIIYPKRV